MLRHVLLAAALLPFAAQAQTYTAKVISTPSGVKCELLQARLGPTGDVAAPCYSSAIASPGAIFTGLLYFLTTFEFDTSGTPGDSIYKVVAWRANGTTQTLVGGTGSDYDAGFFGFLPNGDILGYADYKNSRYTEVTWRNTTRSTWNRPAILPAPTWRMTTVTPNGGAILFQNGARYATLVNGAAKILPDLPVSCGTPQWNDVAVSENGQVAVIANQAVPRWDGYNDPAHPNFYESTVCLWNGTAWVASPRLPLGPNRINTHSPYTLLGVTKSGKVLMREGTLFEERVGSGLVAWASVSATLEPVPALVSAIGLNDEWLGGSSPYFQPETARAFIIKDGQTIDLSSRATLPSGLLMMRAMATNAKGQILVSVTATPYQSAGAKLAVLTPK